jgi:hypothetical protein
VSPFIQCDKLYIVPSRSESVQDFRRTVSASSQARLLDINVGNICGWYPGLADWQRELGYDPKKVGYEAGARQVRQMELGHDSVNVLETIDRDNVGEQLGEYAPRSVTIV